MLQCHITSEGCTVELNLKNPLKQRFLGLWHNIPFCHWRNQQVTEEEHNGGSEIGICRPGRFPDRSPLESDVLFLVKNLGAVSSFLILSHFSVCEHFGTSRPKALNSRAPSFPKTIWLIWYLGQHWVDSDTAQYKNVGKLWQKHSSAHVFGTFSLEIINQPVKFNLNIFIKPLKGHNHGASNNHTPVSPHTTPTTHSPCLSCIIIIYFIIVDLFPIENNTTYILMFVQA